MLQKVKAVEDDCGHWYIIPNDKLSQFYSMLNHADLNDDHDEFEEVFSKYRIGGDLNLVQLYAEL